MLNEDDVMYLMGVLSKHYGTSTISTLDRRKTIDILTKLIQSSHKHLNVNTRHTNERKTNGI